MRISDWSSDVCSSDLQPGPLLFANEPDLVWGLIASLYIGNLMLLVLNLPMAGVWVRVLAIPRPLLYAGILVFATLGTYTLNNRSEEHTSELQSLMRISYAVFCLKKKKQNTYNYHTNNSNNSSYYYIS